MNLIYVCVSVDRNLLAAINTYQVRPELVSEVRAGLHINCLTLLSGFNWHNNLLPSNILHIHAISLQFSCMDRHGDAKNPFQYIKFKHQC